MIANILLLIAGFLIGMAVTGIIFTDRINDLNRELMKEKIRKNNIEMINYKHRTEYNYAFLRSN